jgi:hypothetical protein
MTEIALSYSKSFLESFWNAIKLTLQGIMVGIVVARQVEANKYLAHRLPTNGLSYADNLAKLNKETIDRIHKEFKYGKNS